MFMGHLNFNHPISLMKNRSVKHRSVLLIIFLIRIFTYRWFVLLVLKFVFVLNSRVMKFGVRKT